VKLQNLSFGEWSRSLAESSVAENASRKGFGNVEMSFRDVDATEESNVLTSWEAVTWRRELARTYSSSFTFPAHPQFHFGTERQ
jgi:hypothetical protein